MKFSSPFNVSETYSSPTCLPLKRYEHVGEDVVSELLLIRLVVSENLHGGGTIDGKKRIRSMKENLACMPLLKRTLKYCTQNGEHLVH